MLENDFIVFLNEMGDIVTIATCMQLVQHEHQGGDNALVLKCHNTCTTKNYIFF